MIQHIVAKWYHMLHNPLILLILFQSLRTVIFTAFITLIITSTFHSPILLFSMLSAVLQYSLLQCLLSCLIFFFTLQKAVSVVFLWSCYLFLAHICEWASIQSFLAAQIPQSSAAVPASMQSKRLSLKQTIHLFHHCLARKMLFCQSASVCRSCTLHVAASLNCNFLNFW